MDTFTTQTDEGYVRKQMVKTVLMVYGVMAALGLLGLLVAWQTAVFLELVVFFVCAATYLMQRQNRQCYTLTFEGDVLHIRDEARGADYDVWDVPASDFVIHQTKKEQTLDYCSMTVKNTIFAFGGVKRCRELKAYIAEHYPEK